MTRRSGAQLAPGGELLVGYVGRLAPEKRVDLLAATSPTARRAGGGGRRRPDPRASCARRAARGDLPGRAARATQLARLYASLDVFVHTGPHETFCQTIQEALASGVPVVAPASGGPLDLVDQGVTGCWCRRTTATRSPRRWPS